MGKNVYVFPHTHWDREWYFTVEESRSLLMHDLEEVLTHLEEHPEFSSYTVDGQSVVIEDYLKTRPQDEERIRALAEAGRLQLGPWFTQTDSQVVGAESVVRNLVYGIEIAKRFGPPMMEGYIPDSFGHSASMPTILQGFGINSALFWRGRTERHTKDVCFRWRSPDGSQVNAINIAGGYQVAKYLESDPEALQARMQKILATVSSSRTDNVLIPAGHDQMPIQKNLPELLAKLEEMNPGDTFAISTISQFFADTFTDPEVFELYEGEFTEGKYGARVHRSIYSTRMDIKMANAACEAGLTRKLEPLVSVASLLGFDYSPSLVEEAWRIILASHAHDSMGCCNSDRTNADIAHRYVKASEVIEAHADLTLRLMAKSITKAENEDLLLVFNSLPSGGTRLVEQELYVGAEEFALIDANGNDVAYSVLEIEPWDAARIDRQIAHLNQSIPLYRAVITFQATFTGLGYTSYRIVPGKAGQVVAVQRPAAAKVANAALSAEVLPDGIALVRADGQQVMVVLEESGDEGDNYDWSPPAKDLILDDFAFEVKGVTVAEGTRRVAFVASRTVPADLHEREQGATSVACSFDGTVELRDGEDFARFRLGHDNAVDNHRVRIKAVTSLKPEYSVADNQFGVIQREFKHPEFDDFRALGWAERPDPIYPMLGFCALTEGDKGAFVATHGLREYEATGGDYNELAVTLYRTVGDIGKDDLTRRPGRASGIKVPSPESQMHMHLDFELAVGFVDGEANILQAGKVAHLIATPDATFQVKKFNDFQLNPPESEIPAEFTWFSLDDSVVLSTVKLAQSAEGYVVRFFNPTLEAVTVDVPSLDGYVAHTSRLDEQVGDPAPGSVSVPPCAPVTLVYLPR